MPSCVLRYCTSHTRSTNKSLGVTFHRFLKPGHQNFEKWIAFVQKDRSERTWLPSNFTYICSKHFQTTDFNTTKAGRRFLKKSAVPIILSTNESFENQSCTPPTLSSTHVSNSVPIFDTLKQIILKKGLQKIQNTKQKIKKIQRQKKYVNLKSVIKKLKEKFPIDGETESILLNKAEAIELYKNTLKKLRKPTSKLKYSACVREFALTLNYYSAAAYRYVRQTCGNLLPHPRMLSRWYDSVYAEPGFTNESFTALKNKCQSSVTPVVCSLVFDEIALRKQKLFRNKKLGCVNFGTGPQYENYEAVATQALVFMLVSLRDNWKIPIGYFLTAGTSAETKATLIKMCLEKCHQVGVVVANLTIDGCSVNFSTAEILGCKFDDEIRIKSYFLHPCTSEKVYVFIDLCHVVKLIRNTFENKKIFFDQNSQMVNWELLVNLNKLQQNEGLTFANKLSPRHIYFRNQIMKVKLATQLLSIGVAEALKLCDEVLKSSKFQDSQGTVKFITIMNIFFDVFNSQKGTYYGFKRQIDCENKRETFEFLNKVKQYILALQLRVKQKRIIRKRNRNPRIVSHISKKKLIKSVNKTGFLAAVICIESLKGMYTELVEKRKLMKYLSMYRISQEHLELFFGCIRRHVGNDNPNVIQLRAAYKKVLSHLELRSTFSGNSIPLDNFAILTSSSVNVINDTSIIIRRDDENFQILEKENLLNSDLQAEANCKILVQRLNCEQLCGASRKIVGYVSAYVTWKLIKLLKCEECIFSLTTTKKLWHHKLITIKDMGGLCYSSVDVFYVCLKTEAVIRQLIKESRGRSLLPSYSNINFVLVNTLIHFVNSNIFVTLLSHSLLQPSTCNHRTHLIRAIIEKYAKIRLHHETGTDPEIQFQIKRRKLTKLILF